LSGRDLGRRFAGRCRFHRSVVNPASAAVRRSYQVHFGDTQMRTRASTGAVAGCRNGRTAVRRASEITCRATGPCYGCVGVSPRDSRRTHGTPPYSRRGNQGRRTGTGYPNPTADCRFHRSVPLRIAADLTVGDSSARLVELPEATSVIKASRAALIKYL
jgi:hypothetical protein